MNVQWYFRPRTPGDDIADPISGEFFADGSIENPATALIREALQNALDAGKGIDRAGNPVLVRIGLFRGSHALAPASAARWFGALRTHLVAPGNGLKEVPSEDEPCEYLVVEDFGTSGLTGAIDSDDADGERNNFVDFLRSDGRTRKGEGDRGSWGVGKNVFPRSSRINGFIALTVRNDDGRKLLMGKSILKIRRVEGQQYQPPCYMGESWNPGQVPRPLEDPEFIARLRSDFRIKRNGEPGLSLIIPWVDTEISMSDLQHAVVDQFYYAILAGGLTVVLEDGDGSITLDRNTIVEVVRNESEETAAMIELGAWSLTVADEERLQLNVPRADKPQQWLPDLVPESARQLITQKLTERQRVAIRVPLFVQETESSNPDQTSFDIYLEHHDIDRNLRPSFFREQLAISGVKRAVGVPKVRALVVIDDKPLAKLLRAAEPPNHTDWDPKTAHFKKAYRDGNYVITFVKTAVKQLMGIVRAGEDHPDPTIAIDFFSSPEPATPSPPAGKKPKPGIKPEQPAPPQPAKPRRFRIVPVAAGFAIRPGDLNASPPSRLVIAMAYDVMMGSPWKQYEPADFDLTRRDKSGVQIQADGNVSYSVAGPNRISLRITGSTFEMLLTGFDPNRDLIVRAYDPQEPPNADPAPELHEAQEINA